MNGKRAKALRKLSKECSIGYRPMKQFYKQICTMDAMQEKTLREQTGSRTDGEMATQNTADKEIQ